MKPSLLGLLVAVAACGDNSNNNNNGMPDAQFDGMQMSTPDAMIDAPPPVPKARVTVKFRGALQAGAAVGFHDAAGTPVGYTVTAADGTAEGVVPEGGIITVGVAETVGPQTVRFLATVHGVDDTDDLLVEMLRREMEPTTPRLAKWNTFAGGVSYQVAYCPNQYFTDGTQLPSGAPALTADQVINVPLSCLDASSEATFMYVAKSTPAGQDGTIIAFGGVKGLALDEVIPTPTTLEASDVEGVTWQNLPAPLAGTDMVTTQLFAGWYTGGIGVGNGYALGLGAAGADVTAMMDVPSGSFTNFYDFAINGFVATLDLDPRTVEVAVRVKGPYPGPTTADFATALPAIDTVTVVTSSLPALQINWTSVAPLTMADGGRLKVTSTTQNDTGWAWDAIVPPSATSVIFPTLPVEMAAFEPPNDGRSFFAADFIMLEHSGAPGYAEVRADWFRYFALDPRGTETLRFSESSQ
jgi:hypothetical protein